IDWKACGAYALGGIPAAALGARTLLILPPGAVEIALGLFFLAMVPGRRWLASRNMTIGLGGLVKGAFIATEAAGSLALYISKALTFRQFGALPVDIVIKGLISGSSVMAGTYLARLI